MPRITTLSAYSTQHFARGALARATTYTLAGALTPPLASSMGAYHRVEWQKGWSAFQAALDDNQIVLPPHMHFPVQVGAISVSSAHPRLAWITVRDAGGREFVVRQISRCLLRMPAGAMLAQDTADAINQAHAVAAQRMVTMAMRSTREQRATMGG